jgi:DNA (cytosine-5)-methyltransferase 1
LEKHWPEAERFGDIQEIEEFPKSDLICAGFPCQDISVAGKGAGLSGSRSGLWTEAMRAIRMVRPKYTILENVAALRNRGLSTILGALAESGYDSEWDCLPASAFGAPHQRDRLFVVAYSGSNQLRQQHWRGSGQSGQGEAESGDDGPIGQNTNAEEFRLPRRTVLSATTFAARRFWPEGDNPWSAESGIRGVAYGVPNRVHRLRALGNAIVPQISEWIGRQIIASAAGGQA